MSFAEIREIGLKDFKTHLTELRVLLIDAVNSGSSIGFLPPLSEAAALQYWESVYVYMCAGNRVLLGAFNDEGLVGSVQLQCVSTPNGSHRAEVMKLLVLQRARRRGIGRALMGRIEEHALKCGRNLLVLDTRVGGAGGKALSADRLHQSWRYPKICAQR